MVKFFLPRPKNEKVHIEGKKKKKPFTNCNESLAHDIFQALKKLQTRQIQKTIRKIREDTDQQLKKKNEKHLIDLKALKKVDLKKISFYVVSLNLNVDLEQLKNIISKEPGIKNLQLNQGELAFYEAIKNSKMFKDIVEDAQRLRNEVNQKKKMKKQKAKIKKKHKIQIKKEKKSQVSQKIEKNSERQEESQKENIETPSHEKKIQNKTKIIQKSFKKDKEDKEERTQFKKTGRNKFLKEKYEKKNEKYNKFSNKQQEPKKEEKFIPKNKFQRLNHGQPLHPSWQAKREIKNEMFIQPFQGKITML